MNRKTPQQKKAESYARDRRNTYGENDKASRKAIPRLQRIRNRAERRIAREAFVVRVLDEERADAAGARAKLKWRKSRTKEPDSPLGEVVKAKLARRAAADQKARERAAAAADDRDR